MKKILLFVMGAMMSMTSFAQGGEDVTHLIKNAGFEEDLTFQADGTMKEAVSTTTSLSDRSWAYIAADNTVYARPKSTSSQNRPDGRKMEAVNGFKGQIQGWTMESSGTFPACEWTYFGSVPYDLPATAVPIADDGSTYLAVPARPSNGEFEPGDGFVYLRAGWSGQALYKQEVLLPCARYRLEYWTININTNTTSTVTDLSQIKCRTDVFKDETGMQAQEWTKHEFEFTPTSRFTMQFGYQAANAGSGGMPIVALDGIKLYKIGEADPEEIISALTYECEELSAQAATLGYDLLSRQIGDFGFELEEIDKADNIEETVKAIEDADEVMEKFRNAIAEAENVDAILVKMESILSSTDYAGKAVFQEVYEKILGYKEGTYAEVDYAALILGAVAEAKEAIRAYYLSQEASEANPADYTFLVENPLFIKEAAAPTLIDGVYVYPNENSYADGSNNDDFLQDPWVASGVSGGDQRTNYKFGMSCWNAWANNFTGTIAVTQTIEGLPNGYYTASALMVTQSGMLNGQQVFVESTADKKGALLTTDEGWDMSQWDRVSMTAEDKVLVVDGKLTIGAEGIGTGEGSIGWFCVTDFQLQYLGEASADALKAAFDDKLAAAQDLAGTMHFAADKAALNDSINKYATSTDYIAALSALAAAMNEAAKSEAKYEEYFMEGKTLPTIREELANGGTAYKAGKDIVVFAYEFSMNWINSGEATYLKIDSIVNLTKNYVNTYVPVYNAADSVANLAKATGKQALQNLMAAQKATLLTEMQLEASVKELVDKLNELMAVVNKQNIVDDNDADDYTAFIKNPKLEAEDGWQFVRGNGDKNTASGQWLDGSNTRYIDSYHSEDVKDPDTEEVTGHIGLVGFKGWQEVKDLPNGTYEMGVYVRTPAEGAYIFTSTAAADTTFVEIPLDYYINEGSGEEAIASDTHGPIWSEAEAKVNGGLSPSDPEYDFWNAVYNANSGAGRGWKHMTTTATVTNHVLTIGIKAGVEGETEKAFAGNWFSAGGWTLKLTAKGDNSDWEGPIANGIETIEAAKAEMDGIYTLSGAKANKLQRGLNIVVRNGKAMKVIVK